MINNRTISETEAKITINNQQLVDHPPSVSKPDNKESLDSLLPTAAVQLVTYVTVASISFLYSCVQVVRKDGTPSCKLLPAPNQIKVGEIETE